jgi:hypothetical protein
MSKFKQYPEDSILHRHRHEILKSYIALTGWALQRKSNVSPVRYERGFYIPDEGILHSHRRENLESQIISVYINSIFSTEAVFANM